MLGGLKRRLRLQLLRDPAYRFLFDPAPPGEAVSIDCETTGLSTRKDDIVTVAAIRVRDNRILTSERFEAMVKPRARLSPDAIKVHRLREQDVAGGVRSRRCCPTSCGSSGRGRSSASTSSSTSRC